MDGSSACGFFDMILGLFIEAEIGVSGKIVGKLYSLFMKQYLST